MVLCDLEGNSYDQAAELLHCPVGTIQSRLSRRQAEAPQPVWSAGVWGRALALVGRGPIVNPVDLRVPQALPTRSHGQRHLLPAEDRFAGWHPSL